MRNIYVVGVRTGVDSYGYITDAEIGGDVMGYAFEDTLSVDDEDGIEKPTLIASHYSSGETWCMHDMGISSDWKHDLYDKLYPEGYEIVWLGVFDDIKKATEEVRKRCTNI